MAVRAVRGAVRLDRDEVGHTYEQVARVHLGVAVAPDKDTAQ
ncbi:hypothetical protein ACFV9D_38265 [Streptomyces sp. NPDC059875]